LCLLLFTAFRSPGQFAPEASTKSPAPPKETAIVSGTVVRLDTGEPLKKANVTLQSHASTTLNVFYLTDEQGHFVFENIPPGSYNLQVSRNGFVDAEYGQKKPGAPGAILTLEPGQRMTDLFFKLARTAAISGHVFNEDGEPIARAEVITYRASKHPGREQRGDDQPVLTNDLGEFRAFGLSPGLYYLAVNCKAEDWGQSPSPVPKQKLTNAYPTSYYPNTTDTRKAQAIAVGPGDEIRSVDFIMHAAHLVTVNGKVINAIPVASAQSGRVSLRQRGTGLVDANQNLTATFLIKDGNFSIHDVPPGSYELVASWSEYPGDWHMAHRDLEVADYDIDNVTVTISRGVDVSGHVTWEGASAGGLDSLYVQLQSVGDAPIPLQGQAVKADGSFRFKNVPEGTYRAVVSHWGRDGNSFLKTVHYGTETVSDPGFTLQPGSDASLELTMSSRAAELNGLVLNADSLPAVGVAVVLIPDLPHRDLKYRYQQATTDQNGKFSMTGLTPGDYKIFSWDSVEESDQRYGEDWFDADWLKPYETKGESVHLEEAEQKSIHLKLIETASDSSTSNWRTKNPSASVAEWRDVRFGVSAVQGRSPN
jgi:hypothetical protein